MRKHRRRGATPVVPPSPEQNPLPRPHPDAHANRILQQKRFEQTNKVSFGRGWFLEKPLRANEQRVSGDFVSLLARRHDESIDQTIGKAEQRRMAMMAEFVNAIAKHPVVVDRRLGWRQQSDRCCKVGNRTILCDFPDRQGGCPRPMMAMTRLLF